VHNGSGDTIDGLTLRNVQPLCGSCNSSKSDRRNTDYRPLEMRMQIYDWVVGRKRYPEDELEYTRIILNLV
jgi:5-methylcytosine-specific restriction endonuclease McrA